jgi:hypothetical protein
MDNIDKIIVNCRLNELLVAIENAIAQPLIIEYLNDTKCMGSEEFDNKWKDIEIPYQEIYATLEKLQNI